MLQSSSSSPALDPKSARRLKRLALSRGMKTNPPRRDGHRIAPGRESIPFMDLRPQNQRIAPQWLNTSRRLLAESNFVKGKEVQLFEEAFAAVAGCDHCIGVASGTDALFLALKACDIGVGDEVITVSNSFFATAEAIVQTGARPVFVDIDPRTYLIEVPAVKAALTSRTRAVIPVHLYGQCADMTALMQMAKDHRVVVIEDACQAHGASHAGRPAGSMGHLGCFSFYPTKNLGAFGDAGAVTTSSPDLAARVRHLADHGQTARYRHGTFGVNSRLDAIQAAALRLKLAHLSAWNAERLALARRYDRCLQGTVQTPHTLGGNEHAFHLYTVATQHRDALRDHLEAHGIGTMIHYPVPIHHQPAFQARFSPPRSPLVATEKACAEILSLPLYPGLNDQDLQRVAEQVHLFLSTCTGGRDAP